MMPPALDPAALIVSPGAPNGLFFGGIALLASGAWRDWLLLADWFIAALGLAALLRLYLSGIGRDRPGLWLEAPTRNHRFREDAVAIAIGVYVLAAGLLGWIFADRQGDGMGLSGVLIVSNGSHLAGAAVCLWLASRDFEGGAGRWLLGPEGDRARSHLGLVLLITLAGVGLCPLIGELTIQLMLALRPGYQMPLHPTLEALQDGSLSLAVTAALWFGALMMAPVAEELFFRGLVQSVLVRLMGGRWRAILIASMAFGLVHYTQPYAIVALAALGVLLGYAYERTGALWVPILIHALFNLKTLVWDAFGATV